MATLVFPATTAAAFEYLEAAKNRGETAVAASSVADARVEQAFGECVMLPYVYDKSFRNQFLSLIKARAITHVYASVASVYAFLEDFIANEKLSLRLIGLSPITQQVEHYRALLAQAKEVEPFIRQCADTAILSQVDIAAILRHCGHIYGESNEDKILAMMAIFASAPKGDVIEIGSLLGKSASVLQYLAQHYKTGAVLSVDPLAPDSAIQHDSPDIVRTTMVDSWDYDIQRAAFVINMLPTAAGLFNYLRMTSEDGSKVYSSQRTISSPEFGEVTYAGKIAVIHIDGNHDFEQVQKDCDCWLSMLVPGAWVIFDDYVWAHGDGPRCVGDIWIEKHTATIERAFVCGKALFVKCR